MKCVFSTQLLQQQQLLQPVLFDSDTITIPIQGKRIEREKKTPKSQSTQIIIIHGKEHLLKICTKCEVQLGQVN